ncbi:MAG: epoxyqueuosine reductase QueH [Eubacteriales bacterium]|nr:epoxyqueuosine reductase QueH [Eubacteriales bacterium]MDD4584000.1 epoxyqueuosine reductase QueH [Eubacteriales bacterium]
MKKETEKPKILLHSCCGPCSTAVVERLIEDYQVTIFFYNPNITDREEYEKRKDAQIRFLHQYNLNRKEIEAIRLIEGDYYPKSFYQAVKNLEEIPEGGARCTACFSLRLNRTAEEAKDRGFLWFGTTLSVSPHKNHSVITKIGLELANEKGLNYLEDDFKKKAGFQRSIELSRKYGLYRQNYCGCEFSNRERGIKWQVN